MGGASKSGSGAPGSRAGPSRGSGQRHASLMHNHLAVGDSRRRQHRHADGQRRPDTHRPMVDTLIAPFDRLDGSVRPQPHSTSTDRARPLDELFGRAYLHELVLCFNYQHTLPQREQRFDGASLGLDSPCYRRERPAAYDRIERFSANDRACRDVRVRHACRATEALEAKTRRPAPKSRWGRRPGRPDGPASRSH